MKFKRLFNCAIWAMVLLACKNNKGQDLVKAKNDKSLLWKVSGNGLAKPVYIFGTMHLVCKEDAVLSSAMKKVIKEVDEVYLEIDLDDMAQLFSVATLGLMKGDTSLQDLIPEADYLKVKTYFDKHGQSTEFVVFQKMQPLLTSSLIEANSIPCEGAKAMEEVILQEAHANKKEINGLETAAFQVSVFDGISYKKQAEELVKSVDSAADNKKLMKEMIAIYKSQDIDKLYGFTQQGNLDDSEMQDKLLNSRNKTWVEKFPVIAKNKSLLIAVGAGHLGGTQGFLNLLKLKGYTLQPLQNITDHL